ncbi:YciI family protein [Pedobacter aquatilis]|uniref:YciI family protein n=1 Tax=Pedobacter aquatilis TaxID=351343 RepID=UPI0025B39DE0|nr:YciI family protein [Pedobacter aquatilis]MDN3585236.1 YciI family protein [Pedobacter aquatilis]
MKKLILAILLLSFALFSQGQEKSKYDEKLANKLGSDDYGMKMYVLVMLKTGPNISETKAKTDSLFAGHMVNMDKMVRANKLVIAGPMGKNDKSYRGIFILNTKSIDEAKKLLESDPAIKAKVLDAEFYNWYGSAALSEYLPFHDKIQRKSF